MFHQCDILAITGSFEAKTVRLTWGHEESSVYVAAMLKVRQFGLWPQEEIRSEEVSAAESAADSPWLLFPLSQEPNTEPGHQGRAGECEEFSQHICSLLCTFSPLWDVKSAAGPEDATTLLHSEWTRGWARGGNERRIKAIWLMGRGERQEWHTAERVSHPGLSCCHWASTTKIRSFIFVTAPAGWNLNPQGVDQRFWHAACPGEQLINMIQKNQWQSVVYLDQPS